MKKTIFIFAAIFAVTFVHAELVKVVLNNGKEINGELITYSESLLILEPNTVVKYEKKLKPEEVECFEIENVGIFQSKGGMFVLKENTEKQQEMPTLAKDTIAKAPTDFWQRVLSESSHRAKPSNPNEVIGRAFIKTGGVALGIGLPCFVAGLATCIAGNVNITPSNVASKAACAEASYYLFGIGASLTIISIPLIVNGKRIAKMKFNYTGNGAGVALNF